MQEYDYHIQTNNIPNGPVNTIKQIGEKGPIHTIPAPNLSLKDKPISKNEVRKEVSYPQTTAYLQVEQSHHYQVTEQPETGQNKLIRGQQQKLQHLQQQQFQQHLLHQQQLQQQQQQQQLQHLQQQKQQQLQQQQFQQQKLQQYQQQLIQQLKYQKPNNHLQQQPSQSVSEVQLQPQQIYLAGETSELNKDSLQRDQVPGDVILNDQLSPKELYQLLGAAYPQAIVPGSSLQSGKLHLEQELQGDNLYQPNQEFDLNAESTVNSHTATANFKPEFHSFNYDEQAHQASQKDVFKKDLSSLVTATYTLSPGNVFPRHGQVETDEVPHKDFESRSGLEINGVSDEKSTDQDDAIENKKVEEKILGSPYYSSLPSKEAADRLADLQAAGKINHNLMELSKSEDEMAIFISDDNKNESGTKTDDNVAPGNNSEDVKNHMTDYEEYVQEESQNDENPGQDSKEFGSRILPKKNN